MEQISNEIRVGYADPGVNETLAAIGGGTRPLSRHFNQFGDFFLLLEAEFTVPSLPIHHDVRQSRPEAGYLARMRETIASLAGLAPQVFRCLGYFFDKTEILRPCFYQILRQGDDSFLYLVRLDLAMKPAEGEVVERGTNDATARWKSRKLFLDPVIVPLVEAPAAGSPLQAFRALQAISETYIGEVVPFGGGNFGAGTYDKQGVWMDPRLTQFFSRLFLPSGADLHPFHPFLCHYKTVCSQPLELSPEGRMAAIPRLQRALAFLLPVMDQIESALGRAEFSQDLEIYRELKKKVPEKWYEPWRGVRVEAYLNERDRKEYRIDA
ncbi:MAG: hypothetical protein A2177_16465 [Spirochaetes bacterium RBG_13_68_11]|nr:MAG: hypothetical protein A2177_16465 [Spirochaetes bacterium RBG_13_68_11]